jgi:hypothetical protein
MAALVSPQGRVMNINKAIRDLYEEKKRLDRVIASLEEMQRNAAAQPATAPEKKRGRKSMNAQARQEVSERMKRYWEARRRNQDKLEQPRTQA